MSGSNAITIVNMLSSEVDDLVNRLGEVAQHEPCDFTIKATAGEIIDHLMFILAFADPETGECDPVFCDGDHVKQELKPA